MSGSGFTGNKIIRDEGSASIAQQQVGFHLNIDLLELYYLKFCVTNLASL